MPLRDFNREFVYSASIMKKKWIILISVVALIIVILSILPFWVKNHINKNGKDYVGRKIHIEGLYHNPLTGYTRIRDISLYELDDSSKFMTLDTLILNLDLYKMMSNTLSLSELGIINPYIYIEQEDTVFNFSDLLSTSENEEADTLPSEDNLAISLNNIYMKSGELLYYDKSLDRNWDLDNINVSIPGLYFSNQNTDVDLDFEFKDGGELISSIDYNYSDQTFAIGLILKKIDLSPAQEYVQDYLTISEFGSILSADLKISGNVNTISESYMSGLIQLENFLLKDESQSPLISIQQLDIQLDHTVPMESNINISEIKILQPELHFTLVNDSINNFTTLLKESEPSSTDSIEVSEDTLDLHIQQLIVKKGKLNIRDISTKEEFSYAFFDMDATLKDITPGDTTSIVLDAKAPEGGKFSLVWEGDAFYLDHQAFTIKTNIADLPSFTPYTLSLFDVPIDNGHFSYTSTNHIRQGKLEGYHTIQASEIEVGKKSGLKALYSIPLKLGLYLMEDKNGDIKIEVPVTGDLNDPDYSYGKVIVKTLVNFMVKIIASPLKLFSGGDDDFDKIIFDPVYPSMVPDVASKLDVLVKAIEEKPKLNITLNQVYSENEVRDLFAVYMMKEKFYFESKNTTVSDYFSISAIDTGEEEFLSFLSKKTSQSITKKEVTPACVTYFKGEEFDQKLSTLSSDWNSLVSDYLIENGVKTENFTINVSEPDEDHKEIGVYLIDLDVLESEPLSPE